MIQKIYYYYIKEIKNRILLTFFSWFFYFNICYYYKKTILFILTNLNKNFFELNHNHYFIFTNVTDIFYVYFELTLFITNQVIIIVSFYQIIIFFAKGLYRLELQTLKFLFSIFIISWIFTVFLILKVIFPLSWNFFLNFTKHSYPMSFFFEAKLNEYLQYFVNLYIVCLINFQFLAIITILLTSINKKLQKTKIFRKFFYLLFIIFSTIVTPPDILSQLSLSSLFILIYELLVLINKIKMVNN